MAAERSSPPPADEDAIDLGDDYLSPKSKVAKMLADIDNAPTPSPPNKTSSFNNKAATAGLFLDDSENDDQPISVKGSKGRQLSSQSSADEEDDEGLVRRPQGRAARRMLNMNPPEPTAQNDSEDELYSATPLNPVSQRRRREAFERNVSGSPLGSSSRKGSGLFVSPTKTMAGNSDEEDELPRPNKLAELVAQKRAERLARESEKQKTKQARQNNDQHELGHASSDLSEEVFEGSQDVSANPDVDRILSDAARPTRKASKKAMLEMERETQRLARQQALAHQIKVKKKFSTTDLFARFNFRQPQQQPNQNEKNSSSMPSSDGVEPSPRRTELVSTPPSSPPTPLDKQRLLVERGALAKMVPVREDTLASIATEEENEDLPEMDDIVKISQQQKEETEKSIPAAAIEKESKIARWGKKSVPQTYRDEDSDDDLEVLQPLPKHLQVFDRVQPTKKQETHSNAIHTLRHLSHLGQVDAKPNRPINVKPSIHPQVLEAQLRKKAREQAFQAQQERLAELKAKGIIIQTTEEKEKEAEEFENLLEKARSDAQDIRKAEKAARKQAKGEGNMEASDDETEDEDYYDRSEDEDVEEGNNAADNDLVDDAADESEAEGDAEELEKQEDDDAVDVDPPFQESDELPEEEGVVHARKARKSYVIRDDEDADEDIDEDNQLEPDEQVVSSNMAPEIASVPTQQDDPFAAFGFGAAKTEANAMSATQAFNATMQAPSQETQEDSYDILRHVPPPSSFAAPPSLPTLDSQIQGDESQTQLVTNHQSDQSQGIQLNWDTQAPETPGPTLARKVSGLSETPGWEPTQDPGLPSPWTGGRRGPLQRVSTLVSAADDDFETQATVGLRVSESPAQDIPSKRGRLLRRKRLSTDDSEDEAELALPTQKNAFKEMKRQRMDDLDANDRNEAKAEMKRMMDDQAEESEDEYAGLGGDDSEMIAPETAEDQAMFDESQIDVDERAIAAHHAARERAAEEEATKKLYKDITTGALRRRQRGTWDFDEDDDDYHARKRQMRLREETRKRKLLLQDENVKDWAEKGKHSKGKDAFLKAIADDDELEADDAVDLDDDEQDTADQSTQQTQPEVDGVPLQEISGNKRPAEEQQAATQDRPPAKQRRIKEADAAFSRPTSILEVRESLSFLLDEPDQIAVGPSVLDDDSDLEIEGEPVEQDTLAHESDDDEVAIEVSRQNDGGFAPNPKSVEDKALMPPPARLPGPQRRTAAKTAVVDRLSLKRGSSSSTSTDSRSAWSTGGSSTNFKTPSLLRRATTNMSPSGANDRGVSTGTNSGGGNDRGVTIGGGARLGGNKKSSLAYQARAEERRTIVEASARRRAENTAKIAELRRANSSSMARIGFAGGSGFE